MMSQLTPLERELLRSVTALVDGVNKEQTLLCASLADCDASVTNGTEERLSEIERAQQTLHWRISALEEAQQNCQRNGGVCCRAAVPTAPKDRVLFGS